MNLPYISQHILVRRDYMPKGAKKVAEYNATRTSKVVLVLSEVKNTHLWYFIWTIDDIVTRVANLASVHTNRAGVEFGFKPEAMGIVTAIFKSLCVGDFAFGHYVMGWWTNMGDETLEPHQLQAIQMWEARNNTKLNALLNEELEAGIIVNDEDTYIDLLEPFDASQPISFEIDEEIDLEPDTNIWKTLYEDEDDEHDIPPKTSNGS